MFGASPSPAEVHRSPQALPATLVATKSCSWTSGQPDPLTYASCTPLLQPMTVPLTHYEPGKKHAGANGSPAYEDIEGR